MQLMTWPLGRLGSRFGLLFEPTRNRILHSALGRFFDRPLDLAVGLVEPDGTERVLPFTDQGVRFYANEQFERINSITFRGHSDRYGLRFELNFHSPFYPQNERLCILPIFYVELRITGVERIRLRRVESVPREVRLFLRMRRPETRIEAAQGRIDLHYEVPLTPQYEPSCGDDDSPPFTPAEAGVGLQPARVTERLQSLNEGAEPMRDEHGGVGLSLVLPVTEEGSGIKWRLVWAAHTRDPLLYVDGKPARPRYGRHWADLEAAMEEAIRTRDDNLALSRRVEKVLEQPPLSRARWHLLTMGFQSYLTNTFWCDVEGGQELFSVWDGNLRLHNTLDTGYDASLFCFALWPDLLRRSLEQWAEHHGPHGASGGALIAHDAGRGVGLNGSAAARSKPVEDNSNFLLLLHAYTHWTGDTDLMQRQAGLVADLARYLTWTDRDGSGFPSEGTASRFEEGRPALRMARRPTYLAIKRVCALEVAADLLQRCGDAEGAERCRSAAATPVPLIEQAAWLEDHYAVCADHHSRALGEPWAGQAFALGSLEGWNDYSIHTANALLLPAMTAQPCAFDREHLEADLANAHRENLRAYGCGHTSSRDNVWISQNLWRDHVGRYLRAEIWELDSRYWDLLVASNTSDQSFGYIDTYIGHEMAFSPRGVAAFGFFLAGPRLFIDRLDQEFLAVHPDRHRPQRWPLLPLADWEAGKIPVCVVDERGEVRIESEIEPVRILGHGPVETDLIG